MTRHRPSEVLDIMTRLSTDLERPLPKALLQRTLFNGYRDALELGIRNAELEGEELPEWANHPDIERLVSTYADYATEVASNLLTVAHAFHVHEEMTDVVTWAATGLDEDVKWNESWLPTQAGFAYFDKPIIINDVRDREMKIHGVLWGPIQDLDGNTVTAIYQFSDVHDPDSYTKELIADGSLTTENFHKYGRMQLQHLDDIGTGVSVGPAMFAASPATAEKMLEENGLAHDFINFRRIFVAYIKLLGQTLVKSTPERPERHALKRAKRKGLPGEVTTVTLRRVEYHHTEDPDEPTPVEWSHRWIVRGHWRWQPCGPTHPLAEEVEPGVFRAHIYINPFVKGPDGKPLIVTEKVYDFAR